MWLLSAKLMPGAITISIVVLLENVTNQTRETDYEPKWDHSPIGLLGCTEVDSPLNFREQFGENKLEQIPNLPTEWD